MRKPVLLTPWICRGPRSHFFKDNFVWHGNEIVVALCKESLGEVWEDVEKAHAVRLSLWKAWPPHNEVVIISRLWSKVGSDLLPEFLLDDEIAELTCDTHASLNQVMNILGTEDFLVTCEGWWWK